MTKPITGEFCWNELATHDVQKAKDFYGKMFDWEFKDIKTEEMQYTIVKSNDKEFAGMWQIPQDKQIPPHWMSYILVSDVKAALEKAQNNGATVKVEITKAGEMGHFAIIIDPIGAHVALWEPSKKE